MSLLFLISGSPGIKQPLGLVAIAFRFCPQRPGSFPFPCPVILSAGIILRPGARWQQQCYYGLNCVPSKVMLETLAPSVMVCGDGVLRRC